MKNKYYIEIEWIIDNLMCVFLKSGCVKQKKINSYVKIDRKFCMN